MKERIVKSLDDYEGFVVINPDDTLKIARALEVFEKKGLKELCVVCELKDHLSESDLEKVKTRTSHTLHEVLGIRVSLRLEQPGTLERSSGKAARIVKV